jgi:hypothetical protein
MAIPDGGMTFQQLQNEVLIWRFKEANRNSTKQWLNQRYGWVWAQAAWPFKLNGQTDLTITAGSHSAVYATATDVLRPLAIFNENGDTLEYLPPREFGRWYADTTTTGNPSNYTVIDGQVILGPIPEDSATFHTFYERKISHYASNDVRAVGVMVEDADYPLWDVAYHYLLVMGATSTGLKLVNDPTWEALEDEFRAMVVVMEQELLPADRGESLQYLTRGEIVADT